MIVFSIIAFLIFLIGWSTKRVLAITAPLPERKKYTYTNRAEAEIYRMGRPWEKFELTQGQCAALGFLSGDRDRTYFYNTTVEKAGHVIRFKQNVMIPFGSEIDQTDPYHYAFL